MARSPRISIVIPVYNEAAVLGHFHEKLIKALADVQSYEIIYCDDGSIDDSSKILREISRENTVRYIRLSRNFGKEIATTAGINAAIGEAIITMDADGQHPPKLIPSFINSWESGNKVVIGLRTSNQKEGVVKRYGSKLFYKLFNRLTGMKLIPGATDYRLIDRDVQSQFKKMTERNRITRGLIDWLGYPREYIEFAAGPRMAGDAGYSFKKLFRLAIDSIVSLSISPLFIVAYIGAVVLPLSLLLGLFMILNAILSDPFNLHITGGAYLMVLILFLVGILLMSQGIIGLYLSHIHTETQNRPLYIVSEDSGNES
jgi:glycosyltransferase involved in cell wall biosynthesis